jgi:uncharacterized protein
MNPPLLVLIGIGLCAGVLSGYSASAEAWCWCPHSSTWPDFRQHMATGTSLAVLLPPVGVAAAVIRKLIGPWHS